MKFKALSLLFPLKSAIEEAQAFVDDVSCRHDIPHGPNVPADLADKEGTWQLNGNGYPVAGQVLMDDVGVGFSSPALPLYIGLYALVAVLVGLLPQLGLGIAAPVLLLAYFIGFFCYFGIFPTLLFALATVGASAVLPFAGGAFSMVGMKTSFVQDIFNMVPAFAPMVYLIFKTRNRGSELAYQGTMNARAIIRAPKALMNEERHIQALNADEDKSPLIIFGTATGALSFNGDSYAPDKGLPVAMSEEDISTHMQVFGSTGTGKTTELRTILKSIAN
ncbi:helicase HerA domain-containing protein [Variovorax sp. RB3P1]|uniref:helicase HerA domain-containing protein n=1 Tax=Variovorax sp. RB3P1 TaxID=3443732 RepID=UPI003F45CCDE